MATRFPDLFDLEEEDDASVTAGKGVAVRPGDPDHEPSIEATEQDLLFQTLQVQSAAIMRVRMGRLRCR